MVFIRTINREIPFLIFIYFNMKYSYIVNSDGSIASVESAADYSNYSENARIFFAEELGLNKSEPVESERVHKLCDLYGFRWEKYGEKGQIQYDYKSQLILNLIQEYSRMLVNNLNFPVYEVSGANMFSENHAVVQAYAKLFNDRLYKLNSDNKKLVMSYDSSYPQFSLASQMNIKEENLPFGHFSIADCYRLEQSGELSLLLRGRRFYMPDLHPYFKDLKQVYKYLPKLFKVIDGAGKSNEVEYHFVCDILGKGVWQKSQKLLIKLSRLANRPILVNVLPEDKSKYWIFNLDFKIIDQMKRSREIGCIQIDVGNAERMDIKYLSKDGSYKRPVIIHSAVPGGIERYIYALLDNSENLPLWLAPIQYRLIPVNEHYAKDCEKLVKKYSNKLRGDFDARNESVSKRVLMARKEKIPNIIVFGEKERNNMIALLQKFKMLKANCKNYPFIQLGQYYDVANRPK